MMIKRRNLILSVLITSVEGAIHFTYRSLSEASALTIPYTMRCFLTFAWAGRFQHCQVFSQES